MIWYGMVWFRVLSCTVTPLTHRVLEMLSITITKRALAVRVDSEWMIPEQTNLVKGTRGQISKRTCGECEGFFLSFPFLTFSFLFLFPFSFSPSYFLAACCWLTCLLLRLSSGKPFETSPQFIFVGPFWLLPSFLSLVKGEKGA